MQSDILIAGGGLSGLALAYYLSKYAPDMTLRVLEKRKAYAQDKHWGFWFDATEHADFSHLLHHSYACWSVNAASYSASNIRYGIVRSLDWYRDMLSHLQGVVEFGISCERIDSQSVATDKGVYRAAMVIDATPPSSVRPMLYQQFQGWLVETEHPVFDPERMTLMDFALPQPENACAFMYMLPFSPRRALVEPTLFTCQPFPDAWFAEALHSYLNGMHIENWYVSEMEAGVLPLGVSEPRHLPGAAFPIGMRAGWMRPSTGYAFLNSLRRAKQLARHIADHRRLPTQPLKAHSHMAQWMDHVFLRVMKDEPHLLPDIFTGWFADVPAAPLVAFLQDEAGIPAALRLIAGTRHKSHFLRRLWTA